MRQRVAGEVGSAMRNGFGGSRSRFSIVLMAVVGATIALLTHGHSAGATEPDKTPPVVTVSGSAIQAVEEYKTTGSYELHIVATDGSKTAPQSGVAKIEVAVDGSGQQSWEKSCPEGSCGLEESWTYAAGTYPSEGPPHVITVKVTDHAGNATEERISWEGVEEVPGEAAPKGPDTTLPTIGLTGSALNAVKEGRTDGNYELHIAATDGSPSAPQSGVAKIEVGVDGSTLQSWEKYCPVGSCRLEVNWPYQPGNFSGETHVITVTVRDHAGNVRTRTIEPAPLSPVAAYPFEEGAGTVTEDVTGGGHQATLSASGVTWVPGKYGTALKFDGKEGCVTVSDSPALQLHEEFTLEAWVKPEGELLHLPVITKQAEGFPAYALGVGLTTAGKAEGQIGTEAKGHSDIASGASLAANAWSHEAVTFDGTRLRLYVNGKLVAGKVVEKTNPAAAGPLEIGCSASGHFRGTIDEVRVFGRMLEPAEVAATLESLPQPETTDAYGVEDTEAVLAATIDPHGVETNFKFEYGTTQSYGLFAPEAPEFNEESVSGEEPREVEEWVGELQPETTYHYRVVAVSARGTVYGKDHTLTTGAATVEPHATSSFSGPVGINWNGTRSSEIPGLVIESGAKIFRIPINGTGEFNDELFLRLANEGVRILPDVVGLGHKNLIPALGKGSPARNEWKAELRSLFNEYGPGGEFWSHHPADAKYAPTWWEIWNEPNYGAQGNLNEKVEPALYGNLIEAAHEAVEEHEAERKEAGKEKAPVKLLMGGLLTVRKKIAKGETDHITVGSFLRKVGHYGDYDALSLHPYAFKGNIPKKVLSNIASARTALRETRKKSEKATGKEHEEEKPIWVTELGWPVEGNETEAEVKAEKGVERDGTHILVNQATQASLLTSTFDSIKAHSGTAKHSYNVQALLFYNIKDNANGARTAKGVEGPQTWDNHCGLFEDSGGIGKGAGRKRPAWTAFHDETE
jgi:hypothetical protein